jgi:hypothetical protein
MTDNRDDQPYNPSDQRPCQPFVLSNWRAIVLTIEKEARTDFETGRDLLLREFHDWRAMLFGRRAPRQPTKFYYATGEVGQIVKIDKKWEDRPLTESGTSRYVFSTARIEGKALLLRDERRNGEVEIDLENKEIWWRSGNNRDFLYRIFAME